MTTTPESFPLTPGQQRFIFKISQSIPKAFLLDKLNDQVRVGTVLDIMGKKGVIKLLFLDHRTNRPEDFSPVVAWEDGSVTVGSAVLNFLE